MCGITGFFDSFNQGLLYEMIGTITHRGSDDEGIYLMQGQGIGLAHRRLPMRHGMQVVQLRFRGCDHWNFYLRDLPITAH
jgi:asparagine synthetase B (glutamine-hydrolysing)